MSSHSHDHIIGQQIGNYRLLRWLGEGSFADVYLGEHIHLKTQAAIKILKVSLSGEEHENFLYEARTVARLDHPHIIRVLECGIDDTIPFLIMNYATKGSLLQRYPRGMRLSPDQALPYVQQAAAALHYAHQQKLIHRDVKPENMLLNSNSQLLLSDFGLVLVCRSTNSPTTREMAGTVPYMAPEQFQGKVQFASDQYALGIVAYEWLCGECPFNGTFMEIASQHMLVPPPPLREKVPTLAEEVEQVVLRALSKDPTQRFIDVEAFAQTLTDAIEGKSLVSMKLHPLVPLRPSLPEGTPTLPSRNTDAPPAMEQEVETPRDPSNQEEDIDIPYPTESSLPVLTETPPVSTSSSTPPTPPVSSPAAIPYKRRKPWLVTLLLIGLLIFLTGSASLGYISLGKVRIPSAPTLVPRSGTDNTSTGTLTGTPIGTAQALTATRLAGNATATSTSNKATTVPDSNTSPTPTPTLVPSTPTPTSSPACLSVTPTSLTFASILGQDPSNQTLTVTNCGNTAYPLNATTSSNWLSISPSESTINSDSSIGVNIGVLSAKAGLGVHSGSVTLLMGTARQTISVTYIAS
jgi:serine/threonine protein kinase